MKRLALAVVVSWSVSWSIGYYAGMRDGRASELNKVIRYVGTCTQER
jgi:hypothetical protein